MKNDFGREDKLLQIFLNNGEAAIGENSALDSVIAVYGMIRTGAELRDHKVEICLNHNASVEVWIENTKIMSWDNECVDEENSRFLLYVLAEKVEFILYKSPDPSHEFYLASAPTRNPLTGIILSKVESLPHFKAYREMEDVLIDLVDHPYKNKYAFGFKREDL